MSDTLATAMRQAIQNMIHYQQPSEPPFVSVPYDLIGDAVLGMETFLKRALKAEEAIQRVRDLHVGQEWEIPGCTDGCCGEGHEGIECLGCAEDWPCATIRALDGEDSEYPKPVPHPDDMDGEQV